MSTLCLGYPAVDYDKIPNHPRPFAPKDRVRLRKQPWVHGTVQSYLSDGRIYVKLDEDKIDVQYDPNLVCSPSDFEWLGPATETL